MIPKWVPHNHNGKIALVPPSSFAGILEEITLYRPELYSILHFAS